jgi:signal transduction histidine kinase
VAMRMRMTLLLSLLAVSFGLTAMSLVVIHTSLQRQTHLALVSDLQRSFVTFQNLQMHRREMLRREAALLADLPSLKALMTVLLKPGRGDERTVRDGGLEFWRVSGAAFFALADSNGRVIARYEKGVPPAITEAPRDLPEGSVASSRPQYVLNGDRLYEVISEPLYFGSSTEGSLLGYVAIGYAIDNQVAGEVGQAAAAQVVFPADGTIVASTLDAQKTKDFMQRGPSLLQGPKDGADVRLGKERYLEASRRLSDIDSPRVGLVVLKSYDEASRYLIHLDRLLLSLGFFVFLVAGALAFYISGTITKPLEALVAGARALGSGDFGYVLHSRGVKELRELSAAFDQMRMRLRRTQQELLEAERLATIGRMASSISHDLRHYLSAVYANAEFLGSWAVGPEERAELLAEVKMGVTGMTELIESLLIFSRTGRHLQPNFESISLVAERAIAMVRAHPDAHNIAIVCDPLPSLEAWVDGKKVERALYNLLLNGCQAAQKGSPPPRVLLSLSETEDLIQFHVVDSGPGVSEQIRVTLFEPFVSEGKLGGVGLGLTLADRVAHEHGGSVTLQTSEPGNTVFCLSLAKTTLHSFEIAAHDQRSTMPLTPD